MPSTLDDFLGTHSGLTKRQIEVLTRHVLHRNTLEDGSRIEKPHELEGVAEGSYYRVLGQARTNVNQALYTLLLSSRMGIIQQEDLRRLLALMSRAPADVPGDPTDVISLIDALVKKIVML